MNPKIKKKKVNHNNIMNQIQSFFHSNHWKCFELISPLAEMERTSFLSVSVFEILQENMYDYGVGFFNIGLWIKTTARSWIVINWLTMLYLPICPKLALQPKFSNNLKTLKKSQILFSLILGLHLFLFKNIYIYPRAVNRQLRVDAKNCIDKRCTK